VERRRFEPPVLFEDSRWSENVQLGPDFKIVIKHGPPENWLRQSRCGASHLLWIGRAGNSSGHPPARRRLGTVHPMP
ncbi:MAG TPA: hypothetical protein VGY99_05180, partial [Candidatus Binataceae bacterium]|nr:hypothetical protein [Candidatus Binataceae bacterium]